MDEEEERLGELLCFWGDQWVEHSVCLPLSSVPFLLQLPFI